MDTCYKTGTYEGGTVPPGGTESDKPTRELLLALAPRLEAEREHPPIGFETEGHMYSKTTQEILEKYQNLKGPLDVIDWHPSTLVEGL